MPEQRWVVPENLVEEGIQAEYGAALGLIVILEKEMANKLGKICF